MPVGISPCLPSCRWGVKSMADRAPAISAAPAKQAAPRTAPPHKRRRCATVLTGIASCDPGNSPDYWPCSSGRPSPSAFSRLTDWGFGARSFAFIGLDKLCRDDRRSGFPAGPADQHARLCGRG